MGLNQLPKQLYPHGTAIMNTLQQVLEQLEGYFRYNVLWKTRYVKGVNESNTALAKVNGLISGLQQDFLLLLSLE